VSGQLDLYTGERALFTVGTDARYGKPEAKTVALIDD
jgi:hypothetical protein